MGQQKDFFKQPYAYAFTEKGLFCFRMEGKLFDSLALESVTGADLVNFAFLDAELFSRCLTELFTIWSVAKAKGKNSDFIGDVLVQHVEGIVKRNTYVFLFLLSYIEFLLDGEIDPRVFQGVNRADSLRIREAVSERTDNVPDTTKSGLIDVFSRCYEDKRARTEKVLKMMWEENADDGRTPLERYFRLEQEDEAFRKHWGSRFTSELGTRNARSEEVVQLTVLDTIDDMLRFEMLHFLTEGKGYKFCKNCGKPFIPRGRSDAVYCDRVADGEDKTCKQIGAYRAEKEKTATVPAWKVYRQAYQRLNKRVELGYMEESAFTDWNREATEKRGRCLRGELPYEDFADWINRTSRQR